MIITPTHLTIGQLFDQQFIFRVPKYQRFYAWDSDEIDDFLEDLDQCQLSRISGAGRHHFFGGLVTVNTPFPGSARRNIEVIDGQQRLASFTMLVAQLRKALLKLESEVDKAAPDNPAKFLKDKSDSLRGKYLFFQDTVKLQVHEIHRLELSNPDKAYFKALIEETGPEVTRDSHQLLLNAYSKIGKYLQNLVARQTTDLEKALALSRIDEVLQSDWTVIHMSTDTKHEAYMMFQVLNDRGKDLTEGELLRARTLEMLEDAQFSEKQEVVEEAWNQMLKRNSQVEDSLRAVYASVVGKRPGQASLFDQFLDQFFPMHKLPPIDDEKAVKLVEQVNKLKSDFGKLEKISSGEWPYPVTPGITAWHRDRLRLLVLELKHTNCLPLLLSACNLEQKNFSEIVQILERFVFRYKIICGAHISAAQNIYYKHAVSIRNAPLTYKVKDLKADLQLLLNKNTTDNFFKNNIKEMVYSDEVSNKPLKYFLMTVEHYYRWYAGGASNSPKCLDPSRVFDFANTTIEHVFAQNAATPDATMDALVNKLGNLTFLGTGDNDAVGNKPFAQKKPIFAASSVKLNNKIAENATWEPATIGARTEELATMAVNIFKP